MKATWGKLRTRSAVRPPISRIARIRCRSLDRQLVQELNFVNREESLEDRNDKWPKEQSEGTEHFQAANDAEEDQQGMPSASCL